MYNKMMRECVKRKLVQTHSRTVTFSPSIHPSIHTHKTLTHTRLYQQHSHPLSQKLLPLYLTFTHTYTRSTKLTPILSPFSISFLTLSLSPRNTHKHTFTRSWQCRKRRRELKKQTTTKNRLRNKSRKEQKTWRRRRRRKNQSCKIKFKSLKLFCLSLNKNA